MHINAAKYLAKPLYAGEKNITERGQLIVWFRDELNKANKRDGRRLVTAAEVAKRLQGIPTHDLGRDLYFVRGKMEEALGDNFPVGAIFYSTIKKLRGETREVLQKYE